MVHEEERLVGIAALQPVEREIGDHIGGVFRVIGGAGMPEIVGPLAGGIHVAESRTVVAALAGEDTVVVEFGGLVLEMPFTDHGGLVAGLLHEARQSVVGDGQIIAEGFDAVGVRILTGH